MNAIERVKMIKAMEFIARHVNNEEVLETWLVNGVADGDIVYGDLDATAADAMNYDYYIEDVPFADLMHTFLNLMKSARKSGGLYCDKIIDRDENF